MELKAPAENSMYVVKVYCGFDEPSIAPPFADIAMAEHWIAKRAWEEFDGDAERAEVFEFDGLDRRLAMSEARAGRGRLVRTQRRPPTPTERRREAIARARL